VCHARRRRQFTSFAFLTYPENALPVTPKFREASLFEQGQVSLGESVMTFGCGRLEVRTHSAFKIFNTMIKYMESLMASACDCNSLNFG